MLMLQGSNGINASIISTASEFVIRNGKRWNRYPLNLTKDINRIKFLLKRSASCKEDFTDVVVKETTPQRLTGWDGWNDNDKRALIGSDFAEVVALIEYWGLWQHSRELLAIAK